MTPTVTDADATDEQAAPEPLPPLDYRAAAVAASAAAALILAAVGAISAIVGAGADPMVVYGAR